MSRIKLSLEALEVLDAIARRGSFAAAAEELHRVLRPSPIPSTSSRPI
ncbi:MAG: LysR family transcriptional regulator [Betaproteobacteria bacterium]|nr:LysR family transcriptional regulator [Betaproteobacteria bacterium]